MNSNSSFNPDPYGCVRALISQRQQTWCLMNQRNRGWQSYSIEYSTLAHLLASRQITLVKRHFDSYGIYWTIANTKQPNEVPAIYLGRCDPKLWKGDLATGSVPMGTQGTLRIEYGTGERCRFFTPVGKEPILLDAADLIYLEPVLPP